MGRLLRTTGIERSRKSSIGSRVTKRNDDEADPSNVAWRKWKLAAHAALCSLGERERRKVWKYVDLCMTRRIELSNLEDQRLIMLHENRPTVEEYPSLSGSAYTNDHAT